MKLLFSKSSTASEVVKQEAINFWSNGPKTSKVSIGKEVVVFFYFKLAIQKEQSFRHLLTTVYHTLFNIVFLWFFLKKWLSSAAALMRLQQRDKQKASYVYNTYLWPSTGKPGTMQHPLNFFFCTYRVVGVQILSSPSFIVVA